MIEKLQNKDIKVAGNIRSVFQVSYAVEAKLLQVTEFPPLKRSLDSYVNCPNDFFGFEKNKELVGVIEIKHNPSFTHIQSLVVDPAFFRQGIAGKLIEFVLKTFDGKLFMVETGVKNQPAIELYKKFDFLEVKQWDTDYGIRKIRFEKKIDN